MISREKVHERVGLFYQAKRNEKPNYKTFYINSSDGIEFSGPLGVFVSLGITTSRETLEAIGKLLSGPGDFTTKVVEISSRKVGDQFLNTVTNEEDPKQYLVDKIPENLMSREEALKELESLKLKMTPLSQLTTIVECSRKVNKLQSLIEKLDETGGWDLHRIQPDPGETSYRIFHLYVNYCKREGLEYRLGIFVDENKNKKD